MKAAIAAWLERRGEDLLILMLVLAFLTPIAMVLPD